MNVFSSLDAMGMVFGLVRLPDETLPQFRSRLAQLMVRRAGGHHAGIIAGTCAELGLEIDEALELISVTAHVVRITSTHAVVSLNHVETARVALDDLSVGDLATWLQSHVPGSTCTVVGTSTHSARRIFPQTNAVKFRTIIPTSSTSVVLPERSSCLLPEDVGTLSGDSILSCSSGPERFVYGVRTASPFFFFQAPIMVRALEDELPNFPSTRVAAAIASAHTQSPQLWR